MTSVVFTLDMYDSMDDSLEIDLHELFDYVVENELDFEVEFHKRVMNYVVYTSDGATEPDADPMVYSMYLDVEGLSSYVHIDMETKKSDGGWQHLAAEMFELVYYAESKDWDETFLAFMAHIEENGWCWQLFTASGIAETMQNFYGVYYNTHDALDDLIADGHLESPPSWVVMDEEASAREAECMDLITTCSVGWRVAIWT